MLRSLIQKQRSLIKPNITLIRHFTAQPQPPPLSATSSSQLRKYLGYSALLVGCAAATYYSFPFPENAKHKKAQLFRYAPLPDDLHTVVNWSGTHEVQTRVYHQPETIQELEAIVKDANEKRAKIRPAGSGLSPNGIGLARSGMVNLGLMDKVLEVDKERKRVRVQGGIRVQCLVDGIKEYGLTLQNFASIREQQVAGIVQIGFANASELSLPISDEDLREYCDKNYHQILPIIAEKLHQEKAQQEKLKAVKARLNFEEASRYFELETLSRRRNLKERLGPKYARTRSGSPKPRRGRSKSPREKDPERRTVFKRLEKGMFHRLGDKEKNASAHSRGSERKPYYSSRRDIESCYQRSRSKETEFASEKHRHKREYSRRTKAVSESEVREGTGSQNQRSKSRDLRTTYPNHGYAKKQIILLLGFVTLTSQRPECLAISKHMTEENYLQQKKCIKDPVEIHNINQRDGESTEEFVRRYKLECRDVKGASECMKISGFMHGITNPELIKRLHDKIPKSMDEMISKQNFKRGNFRNEQRTERKQDIFTLLTKTPKEILALDKGKFKPPSPMTTPVEKRNTSKFCEFHGEVGHTTDEWEEDGTDGPMIIEAEMGGHCVHHIYVDGGSSSEILYEHCFWPISLLVKIGDEEHSMSAWMNFMVVRSLSPYNGIIGRPRVRKIRAISSTAHGIIKFRVAGGIVTLRSSMIIPLECSMVSEPGVPRSVINQVTEEKIQVAIHSEYPEETIAIGSTITEEGRKELCGLLRPHLDVWRMCVDFKDLNKACPKDGYPLPKIDWKVESLCGYPYKCFLDAYKGYHQIKMAEEDEEKTAFITSQGIFCYSKMPFGLKNAGATYQRVWWIGLSKNRLAETWREKEELIMYMAAAKEAISAVLMTERDGKQVPIYFVSRALQGPEINYTPMEKLILALVMGRLLKWRFELGENDIQYRPRTSVKGQILADFIVERPEDDTPDTSMEDKEELPDPWILFTDGSSCIDGSGAGLIITNSEGMEFTYVLRFRFNATNNEAEYEAFIAGLRIAGQLGVQNLQANVDSKLVANQKADALSKIASTSFAHLSKQVLVEKLREKAVDEKEILAIVEGHTWMTPVYEYLTEGILPEEKKKATAVHRKAGRYAVINEVLYKKSFLGPWLRCVGPLQANYVLREIHEGSCNMHAGPRSVVAKALTSGSRQGKISHSSDGLLYQMDRSKAGGNHNRAKLRSSYGTIVCRFGLPGEIVSDNGKQFRDNLFKDSCEKLSIRQCFASVKHPQANGVVERANRSLEKGIKARLEDKNKNWVEEISHVLWAHRTMIKSSNGETPFSLTYGAEAVIPAEIGMPTLRTAGVDIVKNNEALGINLDLLEEKREQAAIQEARSRAKMERYYNARVRSTSFRPGDFVYRSNEASHAETEVSSDLGGRDHTKSRKHWAKERTGLETTMDTPFRELGISATLKSAICMKCKHSLHVKQSGKEGTDGILFVCNIFKFLMNEKVKPSYLHPFLTFYFKFSVYFLLSQSA
uniref:CO dehydrogenase flavoprotein-like, FAD-binding, subdomain 2 n=1 Tax=Tanacetum cinerariifolium TaxID=118510 RepID=A0A6L2JL40_TANCI|nr:CO dehydrogenase flavoprotein-like, FAD-binding, subdomain 2 [Tanacetum cinerariifolium]